MRQWHTGPNFKSRDLDESDSLLHPSLCFQILEMPNRISIESKRAAPYLGPPTSALFIYIATAL